MTSQPLEQSAKELGADVKSEPVNAQANKSPAQGQCAAEAIDVLAAPLNVQDPEENMERGNWSNQFEFLLACIGYAIGLGNIWRFPYLVYKFGGGSFLLAYWIIFFIVAFPAFFLELSLGQFMSSGPVAIFRSLVPLFEGLGWTSLVVQTGTACYYNALFAVSLFYTFASVQMAWKHCDSDWNSPACFSVADYNQCVGGEPMQRWLLKGRCYHESNMSDFFRDFEHNCMRQPTKYEKPPHTVPSCIIQLRFCFDGHYTPQSYNLSHSLLKHQQCKEYVPFDNKPLTKPTTLILDMSNSDDGMKNAQTLKDQDTDLSKLMDDYCTQWYKGHHSGCMLDDRPSAETNWSKIACARHIIQPKEFFSSQEYYTRHIKDPSSSLNDLKGIYWPLPLALLLAVVLVGLGVLKGPKWMGKVVYVTSLLPIVTVLILIIYVSTLPGFTNGIKWYLSTDICKLSDPNLWLTAVGQIFFSLSIGTGGLMTLSSYNRFHTDVLKNSLIITLANCSFSFITGFGVFGAVGYMAEMANTDVPEVLRGSGSSLAFVALAQTVATMPASNMWGLLFFVTLALLAIDSAFAIVETVLSYLYDSYPTLRYYRGEVVSIMCIMLFVAGLPFVSRGGNDLIDLVDTGLYNWLVPLIATLQMVMIACFYGLNNFAQDIDLMLGGVSCGGRLWNHPVFRNYMLFMWALPAPIGLLVMMGASIGINIHKGNITTATILFALITPLLVGGTIVYRLVQGKTCDELLKPTEEWGPALNAHRAEDPQRYKPREHTPPNENTQPAEDIQPV